MRITKSKIFKAIEELPSEIIEGTIINLMKKGDSFKLNDNEYICFWNTKNGIRLVDLKGISYTWSKLGRNIIGNNKSNVLARDISGIVTVDLINRNNKLHDIHEVTKMLMNEIKEIMIKNEKVRNYGFRL